MLDKLLDIRNNGRDMNRDSIEGTCEADRYKTCVYFSNWSVYHKKHFVKDIPAHLVTHIFYAFFKINTHSGAVEYSDSWCDTEMPMELTLKPNSQVRGSLEQLLELKHTNRHLKVCMSIGGWGAGPAFTEVMRHHKKMTTFVTSCLFLVSKHKFDGIDIDWEYPQSRGEANLLVELLHQLRNSADKKFPNADIQLTIAAPAGEENISVLDLRSLDKYLSFFNVMCYDFAGSSWSDRTAFHSNLFGGNGDNNLNCAEVISEYIRGGVKPSKLVFGMPCYGRSFLRTQRPSIGERFHKGSNGGNETIDYKDLPLDNNQEYFDYRKISAFSFNPTSGIFVSYDNPQSSRVKAKYVRLNKLGGGMWWDSSGDAVEKERSLVYAFVSQLGGPKVLDSSKNNI